MLRRTGLSLPLAALLAFTLLPDRPVSAQTTAIADGIVGVWTLVSVTSQRDGGASGEPFGPNPQGIMIFTRDGHYSLFQSRGELPRLAASDRARATPEEAMAVLRDSIAYYGTYVVDEAARYLSVTVSASTFANVIGPGQRRVITVLTPTALEFSNPRTPSGLTLHTVWRRAPSQ